MDHRREPRRNILNELKRDAKRLEGDSREILVCPDADPYQSDESASLARKALLLLEQYHLRVQVLTKGGLRSARDFDILAQPLEILCIYSSVRKLREEWEPGGVPIVERMQAVREAHAAGITTWVKIRPMAFPAELIGLVELLRADVDSWIIGRPLPGGPPAKVSVSGRPGFVDSDTALAYLRSMVERGLSDKLRRADEMKIWSPDQKDTGNRGESTKNEG